MYIQNQNYSTPNMKTYYSLRDFMIHRVYRDQQYIERIENIIASMINYLKINYNPAIFSFNIEIQKTTMRRTKGFSPNVMYYYDIMTKVFATFFSEHPEIVKEYYNLTGEHIDDMTSFNNICQIYCIGDKNVIVKL